MACRPLGRTMNLKRRDLSDLFMVVG
jgi:hypothetical protein